MAKRKTPPPADAPEAPPIADGGGGAGAPPGVLLTGVPGFLGTRLLARLAAASPSDHFFLLVEPRLVFEARKACERIPGLAERSHVIAGDLTRPGLDLPAEAVARLQLECREVWHLAALYDLAARESLAHAVNVDGTQRVLDLCARLPALTRLAYVSTCYVAGARTGRIYEDELDCGQDFKNHYESTKCFAEIRVREAMGDLPVTVLRPAIVVGDSRSGETVKGDGPYYVIRLLQRLPRWAPMVRPGPAEAHQNLVPVDFVVEAMARLGRDPRAVGGTFHLADPSPCTTGEILALSLKALGMRPPVGALPRRVAERLTRSERLGQALGIPRETFDYFNHPIEFDVSRTAQLLGDSLVCPRAPDYWQVIVDYAVAHPEIFAATQQRKRAA